MPPDSILYRNGRVHAPSAAPATAMLVNGGRIVWIGAEDDVPVTSSTSVADLQHALVTPAFVDAHVHCTSTGLALTGLDLRRAGSLAEALRAVQAAAQAQRGRPLLGTGWDETTWPERRAPTSAELDRASYGSAVYLARVDKHSAVVSSALLAGAADVRGQAGYRPDGWLRGPAHDTVRIAAYRALSPGQRRDAQRAALRRAAALGVACVHEMAGPAISSADDLAVLQRLAAEEPAPEVVGYWAELHGVDTARELGAAGAAGDLFCDGSLGSHTAALGEPYADLPDSAGTLRYSTAEVAEHIERCVTAGLQFGFHAIGDAAVDQVLDAVELVSGRLGRRVGDGNRIEHAEYVREPRRLAASGLLASMQPRFDELWGGPRAMYAQRLGAERARRLNRFAELLAAGVPLAFGSDAPVTELGPWAAVRAAVRPSDPAAGVPIEAAFAAHTVGGWRAAGRGEPGRLVVGAPATFAVWRVGRRTGALPDLDAGVPACLGTVRAGRVIYEHGSWGGGLAAAPG